MKRQVLLLSVQKHFPFLLLSLVYFLSRCLFFDTDSHFLTASERYYLKEMHDFLNGVKGVWQVSVFSTLASIVEKLMNGVGTFSSLRILSVIGGFIAGLSLYILGRKWWKSSVALVSTSIFWLVPLTFYYSRLGSGEMLVLGLSLLGLVLLVNQPFKTKLNLIFVLGLLLLAALIDYKAVIFIVSAVILFVTKEKKCQYTSTEIIGLLSLISGFVLLLLLDRSYNSTAYQPSASLQNIPWVFSWPVLICLLILTYSQIRKVTQNQLSFFDQVKHLLFSKSLCFRFFLATGVSLTVLLTSNFSYSSLVYITPFVALGCGYWITSLPFKKLSWLFLLTLLPWTYQAWQATLHTSLREVKEKVTELSNNHLFTPIYTSFDSGSFSDYINKPVQPVSMEVFNTGGIVVVDETSFFQLCDYQNNYSPLVLEKLHALEDYNLVWKSTVVYNHFPVSQQRSVVKIYLFPEPK